MLYRPRTTPVEARQWNGTNEAEIREWLGDAFVSRCSDILTIETFTGRQAVYIGEHIGMDLENWFYPIVQTRRADDWWMP